jgi:hypothetical protein
MEKLGHRPLARARPGQRVNEVNASGTAHLVLPRLGDKCLCGKTNRRGSSTREPVLAGKGKGIEG